MNTDEGVVTARRLSIALALFVVTLFLRLPRAATVDAADTFRIGLVFDVGGLGDKSFNDGAYLGLLRARDELHAQLTTIEPGDGSDRAAGLRMLAASGHALVIGVGFIFTDDILEIAVDYPQTYFACIDMSLRYDAEGQAQALPPNVVALKFREHEGSYLAGVMAALTSQSRRVGFIGGMDIPLIHKFSAGYRAGVKSVCSACEVSVLFAGSTPNAFKDPGKGREMALAMFQSGVDVVFHAAGGTGLGVFQATREKNKRAIGVDSDQSAEAPEVILTSMVKRIDTAVFEAAKQAQARALTGGVREFGLAQNGVELARNESNRRFFDATIEQALSAAASAIVSGQVKVPDHD